MNVKKIFPAVLIAVAPIFLVNSVYAGSNESDKTVRTKSYKYVPKANLEASVSIQVEQDRLKITLGTQVSENTQQKVSALLTERINKAMESLKQGSGDNIKITSGSHYIWPVTSNEGSITNWRGRTQIHLESSDFLKVAQVAQSVEEHMTIVSYNFFVSPETRAKSEQELLTQTAQAFNDRAEALTKALGFNRYRINEINLGGSGAVYRDHMPRMALAAPVVADAAPVPMQLEAGTDSVSLDISGSIYLLND